MQNFVIIDNKKECLIVQSQENFNTYAIVKSLFSDCDVIEIKNSEHLPKFKNSEFINDKFVDPRPFNSWIFENNKWVAPKKYPNNEKLYVWNEELLSWEENHYDFSHIENS